MVDVVWLLGNHRNVYPGVPPAAEAELEPLQNPLHVGAVLEKKIISGGGSVIIANAGTWLPSDISVTTTR